MNDEDNPLWLTWGAYLEHVRSITGDGCAGCLAGSTPREGCDEGQRLWQAHQDAKTEHSYVAR